MFNIKKNFIDIQLFAPEFSLTSNRNVKINNKILSMVNNKYVKTINGVSVQCWKKKEININLVNGAEFFNDDLTILTGKPSSDVAIGNITINDYNTYSTKLQSGVFDTNVNDQYNISPIELYEKIAGSIPSQIKTNYGNEINLSKVDILIPFVKCVGTVSGTSKVQFSISSPVFNSLTKKDLLIMSVNTINDLITICELDQYDGEMGNIQVTFNQWDNTIFLVLQRICSPETWELNETLTGDYNFNVNVDFFAGGTTYSSITVETNEDGITVMYDENFVYNDVGSGIWEDDTYRTIEFYDEVTDETLLTWLQENGVKQ